MSEYEVQFTRKTEVSGKITVKADSEKAAGARAKLLFESGEIDPDHIKTEQGDQVFSSNCDDVVGVDWDGTAVSEEYEFDDAKLVG